MVGRVSTVLVTGVSGPLGSRLALRLGSRPEISSLIGVDDAPLSISAPKLDYVPLAATDPKMNGLLARADVLVHLAPPDPVSLRNLLVACDANGVKQVVVASSAAVFGAWSTNPVPLTEDAAIRPNPGFGFAVRHGEQERLLSEWAASHPGVRVAVLRLAMILGGDLERSLGSLGGMRSGAGRPLQFLQIDDAVSAVEVAVKKQLAGTFNVAPQGFISDAVARAIVGLPPAPPLPKRVGYMINDLAWRLKNRSDYAYAEPYLHHPWVMSSDLMKAQGWNPSYSSEEVLAAEAVPTWWGNLRTSQRRTIVSGSVAAMFGAFALTALAATYTVIRRLRKR